MENTKRLPRRLKELHRHNLMSALVMTELRRDAWMSATKLRDVILERYGIEYDDGDIRALCMLFASTGRMERCPKAGEIGITKEVEFKML